jgi:hypothetical protein
LNQKEASPGKLTRRAKSETRSPRLMATQMRHSTPGPILQKLRPAHARPVDDAVAAASRGAVVKSLTRTPRRRFPVVVAARGCVVRRASPQ